MFIDNIVIVSIAIQLDDIHWILFAADILSLISSNLLKKSEAFQFGHEMCSGLLWRLYTVLNTKFSCDKRTFFFRMRHHEHDHPMLYYWKCEHGFLPLSLPLFSSVNINFENKRHQILNSYFRMNNLSAKFQGKNKFQIKSKLNGKQVNPVYVCVCVGWTSDSVYHV